MHGNMDSHPDGKSIADLLSKAAQSHEKTATLASNMVSIGTGMMSVGIFILKLQKKGFLK